jgi:hypothetical protein
VTISYEEFGRRFVESVLTAERVEKTLERVVAGSFETSTKLAAGIVRAEGSGNVTRVEVDLIADAGLVFRAQIFATLEMAVRISGVPHRYEGKARIELELRPALQDDLTILIEIPSVDADDVVLELRPLGRVAGLLDQLGSVAEQTTREIARFVNTRKERPDALHERRIEIVPAIEAEWQRRARQ